MKSNRRMILGIVWIVLGVSLLGLGSSLGLVGSVFPAQAASESTRMAARSRAMSFFIVFSSC